MKTSALAIFLFVLSGCSLDEIVLSPSEKQQLQQNVPQAIVSSQALVDFASGVALGDPLPAGSVYIAPTVANNWTAQLDHVGDALRGASGALGMTYRTLADGTPVDPDVFDFSGTQQVTLELVATFNGTTDLGAPLAIEADITVDIKPGTEYEIVGTFRIQYSGYAIDIRTGGFRFSLHPVTGRVVSVDGDCVGDVDIPNLVYQAGMLIKGLGDEIAWAASVSGTWSQGTISVDSLN